MLKLEVAFLSGLRCTSPQIRGKFFELFDSSIQRKLIFRLLYIVSSQNWEGMAQHYWLKQCIELILVTSLSGNVGLFHASLKNIPISMRLASRIWQRNGIIEFFL